MGGGKFKLRWDGLSMTRGNLHISTKIYSKNPNEKLSQRLFKWPESFTWGWFTISKAKAFGRKFIILLDLITVQVFFGQGWKTITIIRPYKAALANKCYTNAKSIQFRINRRDRWNEKLYYHPPVRWKVTCLPAPQDKWFVPATNPGYFKG